MQKRDILRQKPKQLLFKSLRSQQEYLIRLMSLLVAKKLRPEIPARVNGLFYLFTITEAVNWKGFCFPGLTNLQAFGVRTRRAVTDPHFFDLFLKKKVATNTINLITETINH